MASNAAPTAKLVYRFSEGGASMAALLGGKGSNLCEMVRFGLPVPPGFVISTDVCRYYLNNDFTLPGGLRETIVEQAQALEGAVGRQFGSTASTRSWSQCVPAPVSPCRA